MNENSETACSRFVIWKGASLEACSPDDRDFLSELLKTLHLHSLQDLNGIASSDIAEYADSLDQLLSTFDLGRLVRVPGLGIVSRDTSYFRAPILSQSVDILDLSVRSTNCLQGAGIRTIGELTQWSTKQLLKIKNVGSVSVREIHTKLDELLPRDPSESQSQILVRPQSFCLSVLLSLEQCGIQEDIRQKLNNAGVSRMDDLVTRSTESLRYWAGLTDAEVNALQRQLASADLLLGSLLPLWVRTRYEDLKEVFKENAERLLSPPDTRAPTCLEEELETLFSAKADDRNKQIVRRLMGWDGGAGTTLEQAGQEFDLSRERIRQILTRSLRHLTTIEPIWLQEAVGYVKRRVPATAENVETALRESGILRTRLRVEAIAGTAKHFGLPLAWAIEEWNARRFVVDPIAMHQIQEFLTVARKRVSYYGTTRKCYVLSEIPDEITVETLDLYSTVLENLVWLDDLHDWLWLPTAKNPVLNRLAKILRVAPRLALSEARAGILRDRRMEDVELPSDVFRNLCASLPWCQIEGDEIVAAARHFETPACEMEIPPPYPDLAPRAAVDSQRSRDCGPAALS